MPVNVYTPPQTEDPGYSSSDNPSPGPLSAIHGADRPAASTAYQPRQRQTIRLQIPTKLSCLFEPKRYKIVHGGRGSGKTWSFARALIIMASGRKLRILCCREIQKDITESVHEVIRTQIEGMGLAKHWKVTDDYIRNRKNGSEFVFAGLSTQTEKSIKGFEGVDVAWIEEAESIKKSSWTLLEPTIRKPNSFGAGKHAEIWISFNPQLDTDFTYKEFVESPPEDSFCVAMNWRDNPWFPEVLEKLRLRAKATMSADEYGNTWEGRTRAAVQGAIYADQIAIMRAEGRYGMVAWNNKLPVHLVLDLGWNDSMFIIMVQKHLQALAIIEAIEVDHTTLADLSADIRYGRKYRWGQMWLPHDGKHGNYHTGMSAIQEMRNIHKWPVVKPVPSIGLEDGIKIARGVLPMVHIDLVKGAPLMNALRRYRREENRHGEDTSPAHDDASHGADAFRYLAIVASRISNEPPGSGAAYTRGVVDYAIDPEMGM